MNNPTPRRNDNFDYGTIRRIVEDAIVPVQRQVDTIAANLQQLQRDVQDQIRSLDMRYMPRDLSEQRYQDTMKALASHDAHFDDIEKRLDNNSEKRTDSAISLNMNMIGWVIAILSIIGGIIANLLQR